jgi:hypothetical protein
MSGGTGFIASFYNDSASTTAADSRRRQRSQAGHNGIDHICRSRCAIYRVQSHGRNNCDATVGGIVFKYRSAVVVKDISPAGAGTNNITINSGGGARSTDHRM